MNPLFTLNGQIINVFVSPKGVNSKTGEEYGGQDKVQILGDIPLQDGESRKEVITLTTSQGAELKGAIGQPVMAPVGFYVSRGSVGFYIPRGSQISLQRAKGAVNA